MHTTLVSLVSDQTFINIVFIKEMPRTDRYLFITTDTMERRGVADAIIRVCNLSYDQADKKAVKPDSMSNIEDRLKELNLGGKDQEYIVNLTGGNKLMSIAVYEYFRNLNAKKYYKPIKHNGYLQCFPHGNADIVPFKTCLTLTDYLNGYGIDITNPTKIHSPLMSVEFTQRVYDEKLLETQQIYNLIKYKASYEKLHPSGLKSIDLQNPPIEMPGIVAFLKTTIQFSLANSNRLSEREIFYLIGGWFEEYVYHLVKDKYQLDDAYIGLNVYIKKKGVSNELDIVFVKDNDLHIVECKLNLTKKIFEDTLYKLVAIQRGTAFTLTSKAYIATSKPFRDSSDEFPELSIGRAELNNIKIIDPLNISEL